jgi:hypothetical protein
MRNQEQREPLMLRVRHKLGVGNGHVFMLIIVVALLVVAARTVAPFEVGKDQASQLEAAHNLVEGRGLTTTEVHSPSFDISVTPKPKHLTWWPPGFTLIVALFLEMGLPLLVSLKLIYALVTMIGWIGWGVIASRLLTEPMRIAGKAYPVHLLIATSLPIFFTLSWDGTDILMWAGIPFVLLLLIQQAGKASYVSLVASGLLFGALYAIRYASLFLALVALLTLLQVRWPDYRSSLKRFAIFLVASFIIILPTYLYAKLYAAGVSGISDRATLTRLTSGLSIVIDGIFQKLPMTAHMILGSPLPDQILFQLNSPAVLYVAGLCCLGIMVTMPFILIRTRRAEGKMFQNDLALSVWLLPISLLAFLIAINFAVRLGLVGVRRYYEPLAICGLLIFYQLATVRVTRRVFTYASRGVVLAFLFYVCVFLPGLAFLPERSGRLVKTVLGFVPQNNAKYKGTSYHISYPSFVIYSNKESGKQKLRELAKADPEAIFFVEEYAYFVYDNFCEGGPVPGETLRLFSLPEYWAKAYTSRPVRVFWVVNENTALDFLADSRQQVVFSDPVEGTKIVRTDLPAGHKFVLNQVATTEVDQGLVKSN